MSDRVVIRCPGCEKKLGLKPELLGKQIKCPACSAIIQTKDPATRQAASNASGRRRRSSSGAVRNSGSEARSRKSTNTDPSSTRSSKAKQKSSTRRQKLELDPFHDDLVADEVTNDVDWHDEDWLDAGGDEDYGMPAARPPSNPRKKKKKHPQTTAKKKKKKKKTAAAGGLVAWIGAGLIAGLISIVLTITVGFTGVWFLLIISGIVSAGLIGGAIRGAAGTTDGWTPGLTAVAILLPVLVVGRIGAFYFNPSLMGIFGEGDLRTADEIAQQIEAESSEDSMIADIVEYQVMEDQQWLTANEIDEDNIYSDAYMDDEDDELDLAYSGQYNSLVWAEGRRRWEEIPIDDRTARREARRAELKREEGLLSEEELNELINAATTDAALTERIAQELQIDADWLSDAGLSEEQVSAYSVPERTSGDPESRVHPTVWAAAQEKWDEMDGSQRSQLRMDAEAEVRRTNGDIEQLLFIFVAIGATAYSLLMPFTYIASTISAIALAFQLGAKLSG